METNASSNVSANIVVLESWCILCCSKTQNSQGCERRTCSSNAFSQLRVLTEKENTCQNHGFAVGIAVWSLMRHASATGNAWLWRPIMYKCVQGAAKIPTHRGPMGHALVLGKGLGEVSTPGLERFQPPQDARPNEIGTSAPSPPRPPRYPLLNPLKRGIW